MFGRWRRRFFYTRKSYLISQAIQRLLLITLLLSVINVGLLFYGGAQFTSDKELSRQVALIDPGRIDLPKLDDREASIAREYHPENHTLPLQIIIVGQNSRKSSDKELKARIGQKDIHDQYKNQSLPMKQVTPIVTIGKGNHTILIWTPLTKQKPTWNFKAWSLAKCPYQCQITNDLTMIDEASLVLFRLRKLPLKNHAWLRGLSGFAEFDSRYLPPAKTAKQVWVEVNEESPMHSHSDDELLEVDNSFDYKVTYHSNSDYSIPYIQDVSKNERYDKKQINYAANKTKMALWFVSHCNAISGRDEYVKALQKHGITVDVFGKCTGKSDGCAKQNLTCIHNVRSQYKFYIAFENSICSEYITEKFWQTLASDSYNIPIAMGADLQEYKRFSPQNSYLHVANFTSPKELAEHMKKVDQDDNLFNSYHNWRETHHITRPIREKFDCWLCRMSYEQPAGKHNSYSEYWSKDKLCHNKNS